jgi:hypothetical protein
VELGGQLGMLDEELAAGELSRQALDVTEYFRSARGATRVGGVLDGCVTMLRMLPQPVGSANGSSWRNSTSPFDPPGSAADDVGIADGCPRWLHLRCAGER